MSRVLVIEPDAAGRAMMERVLASEGLGADAAASADDARALLDGGDLSLAIVDEQAGGQGPLEEIRRLCARYPRLPIIASGALLPQRVMQELFRLGVADVLIKPFTPSELRESVRRVLDAHAEEHAEALDFAAGIAVARRSLVAGQPAEARPALGRAMGSCPLDAEATALCALLAEIEGRDADADRGYRAALALREEEASPPPDPHEGLARIAAYGSARPVLALRPDRASTPIWIVTDPVHELAAGPPDPGAPSVALISLGLGGDPGAIYLRDGEGPRAYALMTGPARPEALALALARIGRGAAVALPPTGVGLDLARIRALRAEAERRPRPLDSTSHPPDRAPRPARGG
jgi:CheY-like chemotaxis protein